MTTGACWWRKKSWEFSPGLSEVRSEWQRIGLGSHRPKYLPPPAKYREEQDLTAQFVREKCRAAGERCLKGELYQAYVRWSEAEGFRATMRTKNFFTIELERLGYPVDRSERYYLGLELRQLGDE